MKTKSFPLILIATLLTLFAKAEAVTGQITFVQSPPRNQQGQQGQQGLSPDKKKSLSKYGPEDVFPGVREQEDKSTRPSRKSSGQSSAKTAPRTASTPEPTPIPVTLTATPITNDVSPTPPQLAAATPLVVTATGNRQAQSPTKNSPSSNLVPVALGAASLLVLGALIYVASMLRKQLREGS
ncbi:MAG: hypothetical protein ABIP14_15315 [Blastocatellia bacterium]